MGLNLRPRECWSRFDVRRSLFERIQGSTHAFDDDASISSPMQYWLVQFRDTLVGCLRCRAQFGRPEGESNQEKKKKKFRTADGEIISEIVSEGGVKNTDFTGFQWFDNTSRIKNLLKPVKTQKLRLRFH
jgi:hypothetical protein